MTEDKSTRWILWSRGDTQSVRTRPQEAPPQPQQPPRPAAPPPRDEARAGVPTVARPGSRQLSDKDHELIHRIVEERDVTAEFQPVLDIRRNQVVGFEALSRGPQGPMRAPDRLFAAATAAGLLGQLDWVCRATAFRALLHRDLPPSVSLFVNVEPDSLIEPCPEDLLETIWQATARLRVFIDITGRTLSRYPCEVLETVRRARAAGWGVAVGDVEFSATGLALLPVLEPDVLKVNNNVLATGSGAVSGAISAVLSEAEHTGAALLVERVEDEAGKQVGRSVGAMYQIGRLLGMPGPLPTEVPAPLAPVPLRQTTPSTEPTPWEVLAEQGAHTAVGVPSEDVSYTFRIFATQAAGAAVPPVIATVLPDGLPKQPQDRLLYQVLLQRCPLVLLVGKDVRSLNDWHARAADLPRNHPLLDEFCFAALSPALSMVLVTRRDPRRAGTVDLAVSHNPTICRRVVGTLLDILDTLEGGIRHGQPQD